MCLEVKKDFIKKWAKKTMPDYKVWIGDSGYIIFVKEDIDFSIETRIRVQFNGTILNFEGFIVDLNSFENIFSLLLNNVVNEIIVKEYYRRRFIFVIKDFYHSEYVFPESVKDEEELNLYLSEFCKCVRFYETEIFPKLTDINFLAEYVGSVPFEQRSEIVVGGSFPLQLFKKLAILKWGNHSRYEEYKEGTQKLIELYGIKKPEKIDEVKFFQQGFEKLIYHLENEPNPFL
ncbi:hypothetical protein CAPN001_21150 [Capnocytophaga stomatis]|uniref:Uncharacterized protein n=1 Tax=Capnocytophaga stomatis TaxID=1848904 RepID=A0A250FWR8_9FLAO|nr:hypothetical protein [Capnocytophaga stomatis]ATA89592.1 hypothetical protein CGC58_07520 [Capnocytophaga stomatis]GIJ97546.1 hypothetical protein CAPN001_21150 [Capnocytophaga stomatis]GIM50088.1 hypothetical protein CAPN003_15400 [Capnocytophaga stomatis]